MPPPPAELSPAEQTQRLQELQRRLTGTRLSDDLTNGVPDNLLLRYLAARGWDVDKALAVRACALTAVPPLGWLRALACEPPAILPLGRCRHPLPGCAGLFHLSRVLPTHAARLLRPHSPGVR